MQIESPDMQSGNKLYSIDDLVACVSHYCHLRRNRGDGMSLEDLYRSSVLAESAHSVFPQSCRTPYSGEMIKKFNVFFAKRDSITSGLAICSEKAFSGGCESSLLAFDWTQSLFDGACVPFTDGFINEDYFPGWDSWVAVVSLDDRRSSHALLCLIPKDLVTGVDHAILVDPAKCLSWIDVGPNHQLTLHGWGTSLGL